MARFRNLHDLADQLRKASREGRYPKLTPETASLVASALVAFATRPTADEIARAAFCRRQCEHVCYQCRGQANIVCRVYEGGSGPFDGLSLVGPPKPRGTPER
jgi:hypothetical protein